MGNFILELLNLYWYVTIPISILVTMVLFFYYRKVTRTIYNVVMYFRKGGTMSEHKCAIEGSNIRFKTDKKNEKTIPVIAKPRIRSRKGKMERVYLVKEGMGTTASIEGKSNYVAECVVEGESEKLYKKVKFDDDDYKDKRFLLLQEGTFNFDIDESGGTAEDSEDRIFATAAATYEGQRHSLMQDITRGEKNTWNTLSLLVLGALVGFFMGYALTLRGVI